MFSDETDFLSEVSILALWGGV